MKNTSIFKLIAILISITLAGCTADERYGGTYEGDLSKDGINSSYTAIVTLLDRMYYVDFNTLYTADISDPSNIAIINEQELGNHLETLFFNQGLLFVGSGQAIHIYALTAEGIPTKLSETSYLRFDDDFFPCDPVVADDKYAYATLSTFENDSQLQWGFWFFPFPFCTRPTPINEVRIYDITDLEQPIRVSTIPATNPKGLAIDGNLLFVCDGNSGLKVFDVTNRNNPVLKTRIHDINPIDVIAREDRLIVTGLHSISQYDYTNLNDIQLLSILSL